MSDAHLDPKVPARVPREDLDAGRDELVRRKWTVQTFVIACFKTLRTNPDALLALIQPNWTEPKKPGRPRKSNQP